MIRVLLIDDHAVVRSGYHRFLERKKDVEIVAEAAQPEEGFAQFVRCAPDVTVVDLSMPGTGGLELIRKILAHDPSARVLVFTMHEQAIYATRALQAGALGYVTKCSPPEALLQAVVSLAAGRRFLSPDIARELWLAQGASSPLDSLSPKEFEVFRLIAEGQSVGQVSTVLNLSQKTVANYQTMIREKLGVSTSAALVHVALRAGVIQPPG
jgi:DNA-binding NarL/FixJ family response regulator